MSIAPAPAGTSAGTSAINWIKSAYTIFDASFGISKFNQAVPLLISGVAVGVSLVNRNFPKCIGHVCGAAGVALISMGYIGFSGNACRQFTTAFVWYTVTYLMFCMQASARLDSNTLIGIILSFIILIFVDFVTFMGGACETVGTPTYIGIVLLGIIGGISGFYVTKFTWGNGALYDFGGCSCDDCNNSKCSVGSKTRTVMAKQISSL